MNKLTNEQKRALAMEVIDAVATRMEFWGEQSIDDCLKDVNPELIARQFTTWLQHLPGNGWDSRLPQPHALTSPYKPETQT